MNILNIKQSDINNAHVREAKTILKKWHNLFLHQNIETDNCIVNILSLSKTYKIPLLTWIIDVYHRFAINYWINTNGKILLPQEFIDNYLFMTHLKNNSQITIYKSVQTIITTQKINRSISIYPQIASTPFKYDDNLNQYVKITSQINNTIIKTLSSLKQQQYPMQLDVWIIPYDVIKDNQCYDDYSYNSSDSDSDSYVSNNCVRIQRKAKNIRKRLFAKVFKNKEHGFKYKLDIINKLQSNHKMGIINNFDTINIDRNDKNIDNIIGNYLQRKLQIMKQNQRYILLIDRRKEN
eukprot:470197_1